MLLDFAVSPAMLGQDKGKGGQDMSALKLRVLGAVVAVGLLVLAGGCASRSSKGVAFSKLDAFKIINGQTTEQEVLNELGQPANTVNAEGGVKIMTWYASETTNSGAPLGVGYGRAVTNRVLTVRTHNGVVVGHNERRSEQK
jgi:hypothetical protein